MHPRHAPLFAVLCCVAAAADAHAQGQLTKPPKIKVAPEPAYPPEALAAGLSADVTLQIDIGPDGKVLAAKVTKPAGHGFDEAAEEAARRMEFEPAEVDGQPSAIRIEYTLRFRPAIPVPPPPPPPEPPPPAREPLVTGRLRERGTRDPIPGADVVLTRAADDETEATGTTDDEGRFTLAVTPGLRGKLVVSSGEHDVCVRELELPAAGAAPLEITCLVTRRQGPTYETVTEAPREREEVTRHTLSQPELTTVPGTFGDPLRVIQNLPGIARSPYGLGLLIIRGSSPQDSGVYVDGHRVPLLYHFLGGPSVLTPDLIGRIDFYPGGFGVRYGRNTAGVIDVATRTDDVRRVHGSAEIDVLDSGAYLEGPLGGAWAGGVAARRSYVDALLPYVLPEEEGSSTTVVTPVYWDYQARVTRAAGRLGRLSLFAFGSSDSLEVYSRDPDRGEVDLGTSIAFHRVIGTWTTTFGDWTSVLSPSYGYDRVQFGAGRVGGAASAHVLELREDLTRPLAPTFKLAMGLDAELRLAGLDFDVSLPPERRTYGRAARSDTKLARDLTVGAGGVFVEGLWDVHPKLRVVPGVRFDVYHFDAADRASFDPRIVLRWARTDRQAFKIGAGIFHQPPQPQEVDSEFGNPELDVLWSDQYHAGIEQGFTDALSLDATLYYLRRHDLPLASTRPAANGSIERFASEGRGRSYGLELRLRHAVTERFFGWISYTLSRSEATLRLPNSADVDPPMVPTDFDQTHNLIVVASRRLGRGWELGTRFRLVSGIPETPILGATYDSDFDDWDPVRAPANSARRQTFHQLDLRAEYTFTFDVWRFSVFLDVQNVYNAENPEATIYDYRYQDDAPVRGLPFLPVLGLRGRF